MTTKSVQAETVARTIHCLSGGGASLTRGIARVTEAKASITHRECPLTRAIVRRHGLAVEKRAT